MLCRHCRAKVVARGACAGRATTRSRRAGAVPVDEQVRPGGGRGTSTGRPAADRADRARPAARRRSPSWQRVQLRQSCGTPPTRRWTARCRSPPALGNRRPSLPSRQTRGPRRLFRPAGRRRFLCAELRLAEVRLVPGDARRYDTEEVGTSPGSADRPHPRSPCDEGAVDSSSLPAAVSCSQASRKTRPDVRWATDSTGDGALVA